LITFLRLKLKALHRFTSTATAVEDITALQSGKVGKGLKQFLTDEIVNKATKKEKAMENLVVIDPHLGGLLFCLFAGLVVVLMKLSCFSEEHYEKVEHPRKCHGGRSTRRFVEGYPDADHCVVGRVGPEGFGHYELGSQSFLVEVRISLFSILSCKAKALPQVQTQVLTR